MGRSSKPMLRPTSIPDVLRIPIVFIKWVRGGRGEAKFATESSALLFRELRVRALRGWRVGVLREEGSILDQDSLLALNAYLRTAHGPRGAVFPFFRLDLPGATTRYGWSMFKHYLDLTFV